MYNQFYNLPPQLLKIHNTTFKSNIRNGCGANFNCSKYWKFTKAGTQPCS